VFSILCEVLSKLEQGGIFKKQYNYLRSAMGQKHSQGYYFVFTHWDVVIAFMVGRCL